MSFSSDSGCSSQARYSSSKTKTDCGSAKCPNDLSLTGSSKVKESPDELSSDIDSKEEDI